MADGTTIEWTDATWNPVTGCSVVSPGCTNCYAMRLAGTRMRHHPSRQGLTAPSKAGPVWTGAVRFNEGWLLEPLKWKRPRRIFVCAHGDLFHEAVPDDWIDRVFAVMALAPQHQFQVLTKRAARMRDYLRADRRDEMNSHAGTMMHWDDMPSPDWPLANVWLGVSVEDQARADERIPLLLDTPAAIRWLSCEPLLGPIEFDGWLRAAESAAFAAGKVTPDMPAWTRIGSTKIDWVVAGGESGRGARPMHPGWARSLRDQCAAAGVPFLFKQWGEFGPDTGPDDDFDRAGFRRDRVMEGAGPCAAWLGDRWQFAEDGFDMPLEGTGAEWVYRLGKRRNGRLLDDRLHDGFPQ